MGGEVEGKFPPPMAEMGCHRSCDRRTPQRISMVGRAARGKNRAPVPRTFGGGCGSVESSVASPDTLSVEYSPMTLGDRGSFRST